MSRSKQNVDVELLFQTKPVAEIREVEVKTRRDIEEKKQQLRQVVGDSYRDLIACADTIVAMSQQSQSMASTLETLEQNLTTLATDVQTRRGASVDTSPASSYDRLFAVGSRIKYLVDSPETIYGYLDAAQFLEAARRYVRAAEVHRSFSSAHSQASSAKRFPLLRHQWPLVKKLGSEAWDRAVGWLGAQGGSASPQQLADVLAALALLRPVDGADVLKHHLAARQAYLLSCLEPSSTSNNDLMDPASMGVVLGDVASLVCATIAQCGELFSSRPGVTSQPLLLKIAGEDDVAASELMFDGAVAVATGISSSHNPDAPEAAGWWKQRTAACDRLSSLSSAGLSLECTQWLESVATHVSPLVSKLLQGCTSGAQLRDVERAVRQELDQWQYKLGGTSSREEGEENLTWSDACQWVTGRPVALWPLLFEGAVVARAKALVSEEFSAVGASGRELITATVRESLESTNSNQGQAGVADAPQWSEELQLEPQNIVGGNTDGQDISTAVESNTALSSCGSGSGSGNKDSRWWISRAEMLLRTVNTKLEAALLVALDVSEVSSSLMTSTTSTGASSRALVLHPFVQETCSQAIEGVAAELSAAMSQLSSSSVDNTQQLESAGAATAALFLGRVATGLADRSAPLRLLLGSPSSWASVRDTRSSTAMPSSACFLSTSSSTSSTSNIGSSSAAAADVTPRMEAAQNRLRAIATTAYDSWAEWASHSLSERLIKSIMADASFSADAPTRGWEQVAVTDGTVADNAGVQFMLPAASSPAMLSTLQGACFELERCGGPSADDQPVHRFRSQLARDITAALTASLGAGGLLTGHVSEKGVLQLLFDVRFADSVLAASAAMSRSAEQQHQRAAASQLQSMLASRLDPVDWASYEPHVATNVTRSLHRARVLLGLAMRHSPASRTTTAAGGAPAPSAPAPTESNLLKVADPGPRFPYLPVNTPPAFLARKNSQNLMGASGIVGATSTSTAAIATFTPDVILEPGEDCHYSFAKLATKRPERRTQHPSLAGSAHLAAGGNAEGAAGGVGAAAFEALKQSTLGSLFGDRAAEMGLSALGEHVSGTLSSLQLPSFSRR